MEDNQIILTGGSSASKNRLNHFVIMGMHDLTSGLEEVISNIAKRSGNDIILVVDSEKPELDYFDAMCFKNDQLKLESFISGEKKFKCKGKHQYRKIGEEWVCECNRNIND